MLNNTSNFSSSFGERFSLTNTQSYAATSAWTPIVGFDTSRHSTLIQATNAPLSIFLGSGADAAAEVAPLESSVGYRLEPGGSMIPEGGNTIWVKGLTDGAIAIFTPFGIKSSEAA